MIKRLLILFFLVSCILNSIVYPQEKSFSKFRVLLHSGKRIEGVNGVLTDSTLVGKLKNGTSISMKRDEIRLMDVSSGPQIFKGAALGAGIGIFGWLYIIIDDELDPNTELVVDSDKLGLTLIGTGAAIGAIIGSFYTRWKKYPIETKLNFRPNFRVFELAVTLNF